MKKKKLFKFFAITFIFFLIISPCIFAKTSTYGDESEYQEVGSDKTGGWVQDLLLGALGRAIYAIGWCMEKLGAGIVNLLTGINRFPWADSVIFNSVPLLDVNFINPAVNSLFLNNTGYTPIGNSIRNVYFSGLSIGLGFFGIIVAVMAIKLAISSIASEKAKYKEAIIHWVTALVLLFALHYVLSFVFYINEQLVEVASKIVNQQLENGGDNAKTVSGLGEYFKNAALEDWNTDSFIASIVYAVFVVQSLMFFYAYVKRLFYVVILAVISPFTVVYDFLKKSIS